MNGVIAGIICIILANVDLLSLYDENRLDEVAETAEEIYASIGLFLSKEEAWEGSKY